MTELSPDLRTRLERWLGRVEENLSELPSGEREEILRDIETHVRDALERRAPDGASREDLTAVLDEMDQPGSWRAEAPGRSRPVEKNVPSPVPSARRDFVGPILAGSAALVLLTSVAAAWISGSRAGGAPELGLLAAAMLGAAGAVVAGTRASSRLAAAPPGSGAVALGGASFSLFLAALGLGLVAAVAYLAAWMGMTHRQEFFFLALSVSGLVAAIAALLLGWILGRIALAAGTLRGWSRARAAVAPAFGAAALLVGLLTLPTVGAFLYGDEELFRRYFCHTGFAFGFAGAVLAVLFTILGALCRMAPGGPLALFSPVTDRLRPAHAQVFLGLAAAALFLGWALLGIHWLVR